MAQTYEARIFCGLRPGYDAAGDAAQDWEAVQVCREYCDRVGLGLTVTQTQFVYTGGDEAGVIVGLINYPRFPKSPWAIMQLAEELARILMEAFRQERVTIVATDRTVMIERRDAEEGPANAKKTSQA